MTLVRTDLIERARQERTILNVRVTQVAKKGGVTFAGFRGRVVGGELAGMQVFLPESYLALRCKRNPDGWVEETLQVVAVEFNADRQTLIASQRQAAAIVAERDRHTVIASIDRLAGTGDRLHGFLGTVRTDLLAGMPVFFPASQVVDRDWRPQDFIGKNMHGVVVGPGRTSGFVLSERLAAKNLFDEISAGYRLRMIVEETAGGIVLVRQPLAYGLLPLPGKLEIADGALPDVGSELFVVVTGKEASGHELDAGLLLVKAEAPVVEAYKVFCVTCQEAHDRNARCDECGGCIYAHGHQIIDNDGSSIDGCFIGCDLCGYRNFCD